MLARVLLVAFLFHLVGGSALAQPVENQALAVAGQNVVPQGALPSDPLIRGVRTRSEEIALYEGTMFAQAGAPVGYLEVVARGPVELGPKTIPCTAWLVGPDVIMTAWHCLPGLPKEVRDAGWTYSSASVTFRFDELGAQGARYAVGTVLEESQQLDYALARLIRPTMGEPAPGNRLGVIRVVKGYVPSAGTPLFMVHHAYGYSKLLLKDPACRVFNQPSGLEQLLYHRCDTRGGSSGAPVFVYRQAESESAAAQSFIAVGLHSTGASGGLANDNDANIAVSLSAIIEASEYLTAVACEMDFQRPYCRDIATVAPTATVVYFDFDRTDLTAEARATIRVLADRIAADPRVSRILVVGHADPNDGSAAYTRGLSERYARSAADALQAFGIDGTIISVEGQGETQPVVTGLSRSDPLNRRVEITIGYASEGAIP